MVIFLRKSLSFLKSFLFEGVIIFFLIFTVNNYLGNSPRTINADGIGYYDYLPSIFIHGDINRKGEPVAENPELYDRINGLGCYVDYHGHKVNKYPCGTALLQFPFFIVNYIQTERSGAIDDGYQSPFQKGIFHAAIFYLFLSAFFLKLLLEQYQIRKFTIIVSQLLLVLGTSLTHYVTADAGFSHVYSLFAITAFLYFVKRYFNTQNIRAFYAACVFLGLILILRQINILIVLFIPFLAGSYTNLRDGMRNLLQHYWKSGIGILIILAFFSIQSLLWYLQTGIAFLNSYQGEGFDFLDPAFFSILFSYKKGLFVYTPVLFIAIFGLITLIVKREYYLCFTWIGFFIILTYILSSWWSWFYGCSFGLRAYIDFYACFFILFALLFDRVKIWLKILILVPSLLTIPINVIQTYQYKNYILHWIEMDRAKYWRVFLRQEDRFRGILWQTNCDNNQCELIKEICLSDIEVPANNNQTVFKINQSDINDVGQINLIQIVFDNSFVDEETARVILCIKNIESGNLSYYHNPFLIHFVQGSLGEYQTGSYNFVLPSSERDKNDIIILDLNTTDNPVKLSNTKIRFLHFTP
ncbi:MAG: hypothetical protein KKA07_02825 [Bacteroidetes bacterium]|nr:hypothetical protein [Bacteroidota bacterium]MBU1717984.1 hypothetical protein [Bacteroidota bacterium]